MRKFFLAVYCLLAFLPTTVFADAPVAYGVKVLPFAIVTPTKDGLYPITGHAKKCVFHPVSGMSQRQTTASPEVANRTVDDLRLLATYRVFTKNGQQLKVKYQMFEVTAGENNIYATAPMPEAGCGDLLVTGNAKVNHTDVPKEVDKFVSLLNEHEQELFLTALRSIPDWVTGEQKADLSKHDLPRTYLKLKKSPLGQFTDGKYWYLVRAYSIDQVSAPELPSAFTALVLYRFDLVTMKLSPVLGFLNTKSGERLLYLEYAGFVDLDGNGINEMVVREVGWEWSGYSYLERLSTGWVYVGQLP